MVSPSSRRRAVKLVVEEGQGSAVQACRAIDLARSSYYRPSAVSRTRRHGTASIRPFFEKDAAGVINCQLACCLS